MGLDIRTLFIINVFTAFIISIVMLIIWRTQRYSSSLGWLSLGFASVMVGSLLILGRGHLSDFISIVLGDSISLLWGVFVWQCIRDFQGLILPLKNVLLSLFLFVCLMVYYTYVDFSTGMRIIVLSLFVAAYSFFSIFDLLKPIHKNSPAIEHKFLVGIISVFIFFIILRIVILLSSRVDQYVMHIDWVEEISILFFMLYSVAFALGFLWVLQRYLENRIEERAHALKVANALTEQLRQEAENAALHDPLTLAGNRRKFEGNADLERQRHLRHEHDLCLAFVDIDHFKEVNDKFGHDLGDQVLRLLVTYFMDIIRNIDMVYRWGGEEFIILLPETNLSKATLVCERIRKHIEAFLIVDKHHITVSIGVTQLSDQESINGLVKRADKLLYEAKKNGRNCVIGR